MTEYRPDLLPFALPRTIGLPYHGIVTDGKLALPDASDLDYPQPDGGSTNVARGTKSSVPDRSVAETAYDLAHNHQWRDYALLSGRRPDIGGQSIKLNTAALSTTRHWLYSDSNISWIISAELQKSGITQTIVVWLEAPFGVLGTTLEMDRRQLASYTYTPKQYDGSNQTTTHAAYGRYTTITHTEHGDIAIINVGSTTAGPWSNTGLSLLTGGAVFFHDAIKVVVANNGSVEEGRVGSGIVATVSHHQTAAEMRITDESAETEEGEYYDECWSPYPEYVTEWYDDTDCDGEPDGSTIYSVFETRVPCLSDNTYYEQCKGTSSLKTITETSQMNYSFFCVIDRLGVTSSITKSYQREDTRTLSSSCSGSASYRTDHLWTSCYAVWKTYTEVLVEISNTLYWQATEEMSVSQEYSASFCGAAFSKSHSDSKSDTYERFYSPSLPNGDQTLYPQAELPDTADVPALILASNNVIVVNDGGSLTALTINGGSQAIATGTIGVSLDPEADLIAASTTTAAICHV